MSIYAIMAPVLEYISMHLTTQEVNCNHQMGNVKVKHVFEHAQNTQADLELRFPHMPEDTFSYGTVQLIVLMVCGRYD